MVYLLKDHRCQESEPCLRALPIIEDLNILGNISYCFLSSPIPAMMYKFLLERSPETLHWRIIKAVPLPAHRYFPSSPMHEVSVLVRTILAAPVRGVNP